MEIDHGHRELSKLIADHADFSRVNEAETRKLLIDLILERVLGWGPGTDMKYEERVSEDGETTYADYLICCATTSMVVEAKRFGVSFTLPSNRTSGVLGGVLSEGAVGQAIRQVRDYARKLSVPFAALTNGDSWIVFPAIRLDRVTFEETRATVFRSIHDVKERFVEFWELLSRQRVIEGSLESYFFPVRDEEPHRRLINLLPEPNFIIGRNRLYEYIEPAVTASLSDQALLDDPEALEKCYVKSTERVKYDSRLRMYLQDVKPPLGRRAERPRAGSDPKLLDKRLEKSEPGIPPQFLLVLGPVGAGKTTFLQYTRKVSARPSIDGRIIWLYLDFRNTGPSDPPKEFIYSELLRLIEEDDDFSLGDWVVSIRPAYEDFIESKRRGTLAPFYASDVKEFERRVAESIDKERDQKVPYADRILRHAARTHPVYLVIDNVDQFESDELQRQVFVEAQAIGRRLQCNVIISLRDSTYLRHRSLPVFDAFQLDSIYMDPPAIRPVLSRRFGYARRFLAGRNADIASESGLRFTVPDLGVFFDIVSTSVLEEPAGYMVEVLAESDVRRGLTLVREFLASGHTSADHALQTYLTDGAYRFPEHEIFKGALLGQRKYYREENSVLRLLNIFDSRLGKAEHQLLRLCLLNRLIRLASDSTFEGSSFEELCEDLHRVGVVRQDVNQVVEDLIAARFIQTVDRMPLNPASRLVATRLGGYVRNELCSKFMYTEPCALDASIHGDEDWNELSKLTINIASKAAPDRIDLRIERNRTFFRYLDGIEQKWIVKCRRFGLSDHWDEDITKSVAQSLESDYERVYKSAQRVAARKAAKRNRQL